MNLLKCQLISIINPGEYLILSLDEKHCSEVKHLECLLTQEIKCNDNGKRDYQLCPKMRVAVELPTDTNGTFKRGMIKNFIENEFYKVFLLDYGKDVALSNSRIIVYSNNTFNNLEPLSFFIVLHGLLPTYSCSVNGVKKMRVSKEWTKESIYCIENIFKEVEEIYFKIIMMFKNKVSGDLFLKMNNNKFISLRKLLIELNYCVLSENYFLTKVFALQCSEKNNFFLVNDTQQKSNFCETKEGKSMGDFSKQNSCNMSLIYEKLEKQKTLLKIEKIKESEKYSNVSEGTWPVEYNLKEVYSNIKKSSALKIDEHKKSIQKNDKFKQTVHGTSISELKKPENELELDRILSVNDPLLQFQTYNHSKSINECSKAEYSSKEVDKQENKSLLIQYCEPFVLFKNCAPVKPINKFEDLTLEASIIQNLKKFGSFNNLSQLQRWAIPAIQKGENVIMISSKKTGKTVAYVISIINFVLKNTEKLSEGNGPLVVIVCSSSSVGEFIYNFIQFLLDNFSEVQKSKTKIQAVLTHGGGCEEKNWVNLTNGCHILISTPLCLGRLLEMPVLTNFERLSCVILDEVDLISQEPFKQSVRLILEKCQGFRDRKIQKIFSGEQWTPSVESFSNIYLKSIYTLIIGSYSEAIVYSKLKPTIYLTDRNYKQELLLEKIRNDIGKCRILVACENSTDAIFLSNYLIKKKIDSLVAHENMISEEFKGITAKWNSCYPYPVVIVTDDVLHELKIQKAHILVHYCLTEKSKSNFFFRYATFLNSEKLERQNYNLSNDIILMDNSNYIQLPHIVDFVVRLGGKVPTPILEKSDKIRKQIELSKEESPICENLLAMGFCRKSKECSYRHVFNIKVDSPENYPSSGWVIFSPVKIQNASTFFVKLIEHIEFNGKKSKIFYDLKVFEELKEWFNFHKNRKPHGYPNVGDICAVKSYRFNREVFHRARVIEYSELDKYNQPMKVKVLLIDEGDIKYCKNIELYELPKKFADILPMTVEVKLVGIQPVDFDISWSRSANKFSEVLMLQKIDENQYWTGKIVLALRNIIFLEPILLKRFLPNLNIHVTDLVVQEKFFDYGLAVKSRSYLINLIKLYVEAGMEMSAEGVAEKELQRIKPDWAFFDRDFIQVKFLRAENCSIIFFMIEKFTDLLEDLENACQLEGEKKRLKSDKKNKEQIFILSVGMFCLALFGNSWKRGRIESESETSFHIFFVDRGNLQFVNKTEVVPISQQLLLRLPCQVVECSLVGIEPENTISEKLMQEFHNFSNHGQTNIYAQIVRKVQKAEVTHGNKYSINLLDSSGQSFNKYLVESNLAKVTESEKEYLTNIESVASSQKIDNNNSRYDFQEENHLLQSDTKDDLTCYFRSNHLFENNEKLFLQEPTNKIILTQSVKFDKSKDLTLDSQQNLKTSVQGKNKENLDSGKWLLRVVKNRKRENKEEFDLKIRENILTPKLIWSQNHSKIQLKIFLNSIERYCCDLNDTNLLFRCYVGDNVYAVDLKLYGTIIPKFTSVHVQTFHISINLRKQCFLFWPRLFKDRERHQWIGADSDSIQEDTKNDDVFAEEIQTAKENIEAGILKDSIRFNKVYEYSGSETTDLDEDNNSLEGED